MHLAQFLHYQMRYKIGDGCIAYRAISQMQQGKPNGVYVLYNSDGYIDHKATYVNGVEHGRYTSYYDFVNNANGFTMDTSQYISRKCYYVNGERHGKCINYFDCLDEKGKGCVYNKRNYANGIYHGKCSWYYRNGQVKEICTYRYGKQHGPCITYYSNGQVMDK